MTALALYRASRSQLARALTQPGAVAALLRGPGGAGATTHPLAPLETLRGAAPPAPAAPLSLRSFMASAFDGAQLQVAIPALGESITDGTVAAILKAPGDSVEEDEPIVQIETDKVTIDVRAPRAGIIDAILVSGGRGAAGAAESPNLNSFFTFLARLQVKEDENVEVGRIVATVTEGAQAARAEGRPPKQAPPPPAAEAAVAAAPAEPAPEPVAPEAAAGPAPRQPSIQFPPRRTAGGDIISMLPAAEAATATAAAAAAAPRPQRMRAEPAHSQFFVRQLTRPAGPPPLPRKQLSEWEIEQIMLGGADCM